MQNSGNTTGKYLELEHLLTHEPSFEIYRSATDENTLSGFDIFMILAILTKWRRKNW